MKESLTSIAMATYNGERFLREQLDSLTRQTLLPRELVACDDGSTDGTLAVLRRFAGESPFPVRIYENGTQLGYGPNFLKAASLCSGDLIAFCDQDDVWLEYKLERCSDVISEARSALVIHSAEVVDEQLAPVGSRTSRVRRRVRFDAAWGRRWTPLRERLVASVGSVKGFTCFFRSRLLTQVPPCTPIAGPNIGHETWLLFAAESIGGIALIPDVLALYRQHGNNAKGFRKNVQPERDIAADLRVGQTAYAHKAELASACAQIVFDAAARSPEISVRLNLARRWYERQADVWSRRAALYSGSRSPLTVAPQLLSMALSGAYRPRVRGGLGLLGLAKDLFMPLLQQTTKGRRGAGGFGVEAPTDNSHSNQFVTPVEKKDAIRVRAASGERLP